MKRYRNDPRLRERHHARWMVGHRLASGTIQRQPCEVCGDEQAQAHHDDYSKPLEIRWLCREDHKNQHFEAAS